MGALILAGVVGGVAMWSLGGSRRVSHVASLALTWTTPVFVLACAAAAYWLRPGCFAEAAVCAAWSMVGMLVLGYSVGRLLAWLPRRGPPEPRDHD